MLLLTRVASLALKWQIVSSLMCVLKDYSCVRATHCDLGVSACGRIGGPGGALLATPRESQATPLQSAFGVKRSALIDELPAFERLERAPETPPPERPQED